MFTVTNCIKCWNGLRAIWHHTLALVSYHSAKGTWPEAIVVGLDSDNPNRRFQDFALPKELNPEFNDDKGPDRLYKALRDEVLPYLQKKYPIQADKQILMGHSMGGVFTWYVALRHAPPNAPLFSAYVAADAGIGKELFVLEKWHAERAKDLPVRIFATRAIYNGPAQQIPFDALIERINGRKFPGLTLKSEVLDTDHGGALVPSYEQGLAFAFGVAP